MKTSTITIRLDKDLEILLKKASTRSGKNKSEIYRISKVDGTELLTLDLVLVTPGLEDVWEKRELFDWLGGRIVVVSRDGLMKMKRLSGRDQDLLDLKMLGMNDHEQST